MRLPWRPLVMLSPAILLLLVFLALPLVVTVAFSVAPNDLVHFEGVSLANFRYLLEKPFYLEVVLRTLRLSLSASVISVLLGYPAALLLCKASERLANVAMMGVTFPILSGPLVVILGWMVVLSSSGPLARFSSWLGFPEAGHLLGTETAVVIGLVHYTLPFAILTLFASLRQISATLHEAAQSLGAGPVDRFLRVTLPLSLPGVLSASVICFCLGISAYIGPHYLGGQLQHTLATLIAGFVLGTFNNQLASAIAIILLGVMAAVVLLFSSLVSRFIRG